jgi:hypothetical protein
MRRSVTSAARAHILKRIIHLLLPKSRPKGLRRRFSAPEIGTFEQKFVVNEESVSQMKNGRFPPFSW